MSFYQSLLNTFPKNQPILIGEISYRNYSQPWIYKELAKLCDQEKIVRFEKGGYYIPTQTILGRSLLNPRDVIEKKYIKNGNDVFGYYSGYAFLNQLGLSSQMPDVIDLYTNKETSVVREVIVGKQKVRLRRARATVNRGNAAVLSFLELMNTVTPAFLDQGKKQTIRDFMKSAEIERREITRYAPFFPDKVMRNLVESEVIYDAAQ